MTKPLDPEIKVMRAVHRALESVEPATQHRILEWDVARRAGLPAIRLPLFNEGHSTPEPDDG